MRIQRSAALQADLEERLAEIVRSVNERKDHIPPVVSSATVTFPFEISIAGCGIHVRCQVASNDGMEGLNRFLDDGCSLTMSAALLVSYADAFATALLTALAVLTCHSV